MALYKVGDRLLTAEEYDQEVVFKWKIGLFVIGAAIAGFATYGFLPSGWEKWARFAIVIISGLAGGCCLAYFARQIEIFSFWLLRAAFLFIIGAVLWSFI